MNKPSVASVTTNKAFQPFIKTLAIAVLIFPA